MCLKLLSYKLLIVALVAGSSSWGVQNDGAETIVSVVPLQIERNTQKSASFDEESLLVFERSLPAVHQALVTDEWESLDGFAKYSLISPQLRKRWGAENPYEAVASINQLEEALLTENTPALDMVLAITSRNLLSHHELLVKHHEGHAELLRKHQASAQERKILGLKSLPECLTNLVNSEHKSLLFAEQRFRTSLLACMESDVAPLGSNSSESSCRWQAWSKFDRELNTVFDQSLSGAIDCWKTHSSNIRTILKKTPSKRKAP